MSKDVIGLINLQEAKPLPEINTTRPIAALPVGGKYRLVDFTLSNMVNAGVENVGILLPTNSRSILDHIRSGKEWGLAHKGDGLFYLPMGEEDAENDVAAYYHNLIFVRRGGKPYLILSTADRLQTVDYEKVLHFHRQHNADVTLVYKEATESVRKPRVLLDTADTGRVTGLRQVSAFTPGDKVFAGCLVIDSRTFISMVEAAYAKGQKSFIMEALAENLSHLTVFGCPVPGYSRKIDDVESYFQVNMELRDPELWRKFLFPDPDHRIRTKINDEAPAKYGEQASVRNSLVANGCIIEGTVENSILFRRVTVAPGAVVKNSIIMQYTDIGPDASLDYVICDKGSAIQAEADLSGSAEKPLCIGKRTGADT